MRDPAVCLKEAERCEAQARAFADEGLRQTFGAIAAQWRAQAQTMLPAPTHYLTLMELGTLRRDGDDIIVN